MTKIAKYCDIETIINIINVQCTTYWKSAYISDMHGCFHCMGGGGVGGGL